MNMPKLYIALIQLEINLLKHLGILCKCFQYWDTLLIYFITAKLDPIKREWQSKLFSDILTGDFLLFLKQKSKM